MLSNQHWLFSFFSDYDFEVNFTTSSVLKFTPNWRQDGRRLFCIAYNPGIIAATEGAFQEVQTAIARLLAEDENEENGKGEPQSWERVGNLKSQSTTMHSSINSAAVLSKLVASDSLLLDIKCKWSSFYITLLYSLQFFILTANFFSHSILLTQYCWIISVRPRFNRRRGYFSCDFACCCECVLVCC